MSKENNENLLEKFLSAHGYISIQMEKSAVGHFEINAKIENKKVLQLVDTGASKTVLHNETANSIGLSLNEETNCGGGLGTVQAAVSSSIVDNLQIGKMVFKSFTIHILDFSHPIAGIEARGGKRIDGVIGGDILGSKTAIIDYGNAKLYLKDGE